MVSAWNNVPSWRVLFRYCFFSAGSFRASALGASEPRPDQAVGLPQLQKSVTELFQVRADF